MSSSDNCKPRPVRRVAGLPFGRVTEGGDRSYNNLSVASDLSVGSQAVIPLLYAEEIASLGNLELTVCENLNIAANDGTLSFGHDLDVVANNNLSLTANNGSFSFNNDLTIEANNNFDIVAGNVTINGNFAVPNINACGLSCNGTLNIVSSDSIVINAPNVIIPNPGKLTVCDLVCTGNLEVNAGNLVLNSNLYTDTLTAIQGNVGQLNVGQLQTCNIACNNLSPLVLTANNVLIDAPAGMVIVNSNLILSNDLTVAGNADVNGTLTVCNLVCTGDLNINTANLVLNSNLKTNTMTVNQFLDVQGNANIEGVLNVCNIACPNGTLNIAANLIELNSNNLQVTGQTEFVQDVTVLGNVAILQNLNTDNLFVTNVATFAGDAFVCDIICNNQLNLNAPNVVTNANLSVTGNASVGNNLVVANTTTTNNLVVNNNLQANNGSFGNNLLVANTTTTNNLVVNNNLSANNGSFGNNLTVANTTTTNNLVVNNNLQANNGSFGNNLNVTNTTRTNVLVVNNNLQANNGSFGNNLTVANTTTTNNLVVNNNLSANNGSFGNNLIVANTTTTNNLVVNNNLSANNGSFGNNLTVTSTTTTNTLVVNNNLTANNGSFGNNLVVANTTTTNILVVNSNLSANNGSFGNNLIVANTTTTNNLVVNANASIANLNVTQLTVNLNAQTPTQLVDYNPATRSLGYITNAVLTPTVTAASTILGFDPSTSTPQQFVVGSDSPAIPLFRNAAGFINTALSSAYPGGTTISGAPLQVEYGGVLGDGHLAIRVSTPPLTQQSTGQTVATGSTDILLFPTNVPTLTSPDCSYLNGIFTTTTNNSYGVHVSITQTAVAANNIYRLRSGNVAGAGVIVWETGPTTNQTYIAFTAYLHMASLGTFDFHLECINNSGGNVTLVAGVSTQVQVGYIRV
jgi:hypothetical protein